LNYFVVANAVLYVLAACYSSYAGRHAWGTVYLSYGVSAFVIAYLEGKG